MLQRLQTIARSLTAAAAAAAAAATFVSAVIEGYVPLAVAVLAALLLRLQGPSVRARQLGAAVLVMAVAAVAGVVGGPAGPLLVALLLIVADYGLGRPSRTVIAVGAVAAATVAGTAVVVGGAALQASWGWSFALLPLIGLLAGRISGSQSLEGTAALESATMALDEVLALAERIPGGFDRWSVATAVHLEVLAASGLAGRDGPVPHVLLVEQGVLFGTATPIARQPVGLLAELPRQRLGRQWVRFEGADLPPALASRVRPGPWLLHRLGGDGTNGVVLVPMDTSRAAMPAIEEVLRPAAVALANVARFERLEDLAIDTARTRLAHDLHDGVAQALTHVRFELDLLGLEHPDLVDEVQRIRRVADAALLDVRRTVGELRDSAPFSDRVRRHVELLSSFAGVTIVLDMPDGLELSEAVADDVFRIVQEALSNALRHAAASAVHVAVAEEDGHVSLVVADDGIGIDDRSHRGVGLGAMASRARRLGGDLVVRQRGGGGTAVELVAPSTTPPRSPGDTASDAPARSGR